MALDPLPPVVEVDMNNPHVFSAYPQMIIGQMVDHY
jgi:hypothetical protein